MYEYKVLSPYTYIFYTCNLCYIFLFRQNDYDIKGPKPKPFFRTNSCVDDYYSGNLDAVLNKVNLADVAVVMFYAPWDADSIDSQEAFIEACNINKDEVNENKYIYDC